LKGLTNTKRGEKNTKRGEKNTKRGDIDTFLTYACISGIIQAKI